MSAEAIKANTQDVIQPRVNRVPQIAVETKEAEIEFDNEMSETSMNELP